MHHGIALVDLNGDGKNDLITAFQNDRFFCGEFGASCQVLVFMLIKIDKGNQDSCRWIETGEQLII